jgi:hypothetical protein
VRADLELRLRRRAHGAGLHLSAPSVPSSPTRLGPVAPRCPRPHVGIGPARFLAARNVHACALERSLRRGALHAGGLAGLISERADRRLANIADRDRQRVADLNRDRHSFRWTWSAIVQPQGHGQLNGVIYPSAIHPAGVNIVVFDPVS